jgi:hypothetical protein
MLLIGNIDKDHFFPPRTRKKTIPGRSTYDPATGQVVGEEKVLMVAVTHR